MMDDGVVEDDFQLRKVHKMIMSPSCQIRVCK